ncbi:putative ATP-dependent DNA helicase RecS [Mytilus galloprovincialis]|uniref:putative ATP-dependent DNA helicase RecS n=1 Tax=Mytilus galloprovincialis TaxID=29158 RepID=UPI003F7BD8A0
MALESKKIRGAAIMKDAPAEDIKVMKDGNVDIVFASPEILKGKTLDDLRLLESQICLLVFDECDCISEWGLDFRPEYRKVADIISLFAKCPTLLLTATATEKIQEDLYSLLALDNETKLVAVLPDRPNVYLHVEKR